MPGWYHGICECCDTEPPPPPPLPCCGAGICGVSDIINHFIVGVSFTPCPPITCQFLVGGPPACPTTGSRTIASLATTLGVHVVPANATCVCGALGSCRYIKTTLAFSEIIQGFGEACEGQPPSANFSCNANPGTQLCSNPVTPAGSRALAYIAVQAQGGLGGASDGITIVDAIHNFTTSGARCPQTNECGTCSQIQMVQLAQFFFTAQEKAALCNGQTIGRTINSSTACQTFQPGGEGICSQLVGSYRAFTGNLDITITRG